MYVLKMLVIRRMIGSFHYGFMPVSSSSSTSKDHPIPKLGKDHIRSALYPLTVADFPKQVSPDLHLIKIFRDTELLRENCEQRNLKVDINQLSLDYQRWQEHKQEYRRLRDLNYVQQKLREHSAKANDQESNDFTISKKLKKTALKYSTVEQQSLDGDRAEFGSSTADSSMDEHILMSDEEFELLKKQYDEFREHFRLFDQRFVVACLHLPAAQHIGVPAKPSPGITLYESSLPIVKHAFNSKTWNELCHVEHNDVSVFGRYWLGIAPLRKHQFVHFICTELNKLGFQEMSSVSMTKPFIQEALGANINESRHVLTTYESSDDPRSRSLISSGLGSLATVLVPIVRRSFMESDLPYFVFTQGATYNVDEEQTHRIQLLAMTNEFDVHLKNFQDPLLDSNISELESNSNNISIKREKEYNDLLKETLRNKDPYRFQRTSSLDELFRELTRFMYNLYEHFRLPYRIQNCPSDKLRSYESMRLDYELFLPSANAYVRVGSVSLIGDYLSRRLMIRYKRDKETKKEKSLLKDEELPRETNFNYVQMIHVQVVDVDMLTKCYVEKEQRSFSQKNTW